MHRVALVAPAWLCQGMLVEVARSRAVELDLPYLPGCGPDELDRAADAAIVSGPVTGLVGWAPVRGLSELTESLAGLGAAVVPLARPRGVQPPTLLKNAGQQGGSRILVDTYGTVPYADLDPSRVAGLAYLLMFGMMFGDVGQGALLLAAGLLLRSGRISRLDKLRRIWRFVAGAGLASMAFGVLYGEAFGPTGLVPVVWLEPVSHATSLLLAALMFGAVLLGGAYALGTINRAREGGWAYALYAPSGVAGFVLFASVGLLAWGLTGGIAPLVRVAAVLCLAALVLIFIGLFAEAGGGGTGLIQAFVELADTVIRLGSNLVSFARLAAFGLMHAALMLVVWRGTTALRGAGWRAVAAVLVFVLGNALAFALEALVAGIQALRLEYYELFSRIFQVEGRPFHPWSPVLSLEGPSEASAAEYSDQLLRKVSP
ncbi:MAG TPA: V-type ATPase 116kDa subunit family protein [Dermatophilaceae bacterium]